MHRAFAGCLTTLRNSLTLDQAQRLQPRAFARLPARDLLGRQAGGGAAAPASRPGRRPGPALSRLPSPRSAHRCAAARHRLVVLLTAPRKLFPVPLNDPELFTAIAAVAAIPPRRSAALCAKRPPGFSKASGSTAICASCPKYVTVPVLLLLAEHDRIIDNAGRGVSSSVRHCGQERSSNIRSRITRWSSSRVRIAILTI